MTLVDVGRTKVDVAVQRVRDSAWSVGQCAIAAATAWALASALLGHPRPFFACVAAVVCLGVRAAQRLRRVAELAVGVTIGVAVGDLLVTVIGAGAWQIGLVVGVALLLAVALDGGPLLVAQTGLQAVFVVALPRTPGSGLARWEDALIGGACALLIAALLPADPWRSARRRAVRTLTELAEAVRCCARALEDGDAGEAAEALAGSRATQAGLDAWAEALVTGRDISRLSPMRRDGGQTHGRLVDLHAGIDRATRNLRVLARRVVFSLETGEVLPAGLAVELRRLADVIDLVREDPEGQAPPELLRLAAELDPEALGTAGLSASVVVAQLRSAVVDLLVATGVPMAQARTALPPLH